MILITINNDLLEELSLDLNSLLEDYSKNITNIDNTVKNIQNNNIWLGEDNIKFTNTYSNYKIYFDKVIELLEKYKSYLNNTSNIYRALENDYKTRNIDE